MLRCVHIARLAFQHSPEREQRLLQFAAVPASSDEDEPEIESSILPFFRKNKKAEPAPSGDFTLSDRQQFNDAIFKAVMPDDQRRVLENFRPEIEKHLGEVEAPTNEQDLDEIIELTRLSIVDELNREERERNEIAGAIRNIDTSVASDEEIKEILELHQELIGRYFKLSPKFDPKHAMNLLQALLFKDIERIRARDHQREKGIKWSFLKREEFEDLFRKIKRLPAEKQIPMPNAFTYGNTMYFNTDHADFADESTRDLRAQRAVTHEATHLALRAAKPQFGLEAWTNMLRSHPDWKKLVGAMEEVYKTDPEYLKETGSRNNRIVDEALATYIANIRHPVPPELASQPSFIAKQKMCDVLDGIFAHPMTGFTKTLKNDLEERIDRFLEVKTRSDDTAQKTVGTLLTDASEEVQIQRHVAELARSRTIKNASGETLVANNDEGVELAAADLQDAAENSKNPKTPAALLALKGKVGIQLTRIKSKYPNLREKVSAENIDAKAKRETLAVMDQNTEWIAQQEDDLLLIQHTVGGIADAEMKLKEPLSVEAKRALYDACSPKGAPNPYAHLTDASPPEKIAAADNAFESSRKEALDIFHEALTKSERIADRIEKATEVPEDLSTHGEEPGGIMNWFRKNVWGPNSGIVWITPLNIMNIIKIYKEAIVENYSSNQRIKENRFAKELNFYTPIQHTLNKQTRSSNEKETSEFKEYIEREGFTFEDVFGKDGKGKNTGLLAQNRHNFNRAKAVLLYAADHAWLYFMNRLDGHDVYGIDYETIEGHQSFEELVAQHESGKKKQIDHGVERVNLDADVDPIMKTMIHELRQKNIFAVQGIMQRLQDKAKFSHSNTWMLTTLLMLIRDECEGDPTLKYCLDKGMIDNISNHTIVQSAWSISWLKMLRNQIDDWKNKPGKDGFENNILTKTMGKIERKLKACGANFPDSGPDAKEGRMAKYEAISFVLAGKTFSDDTDEVVERKLLRFGWNPGARISIYDDEFNDYRDAFDQYTEQASCDPSKTDPDYFNVRVGGSDVMLVNFAQMVKILKFTSTSTFQEDEKARGFFAQVFKRSRELQGTNPAAHANFNREMSKKLSMWWRQEVDDGRRNKFQNNTDQVGDNITEELIKLDLVDDDVKKEMNALRWRTKDLPQIGPAHVRTEDPKVAEEKKKQAAA